ncbi:MAG: acyl carrier protein [Acutalibacteraceae bacterium]|nr:acyl carrier protein [Acutalibacteraceae bacterium]
MVFEKVCNILASQFDIDESEITMDTDLVNDLNADSLDFVDLIMSLEDEFSAEFQEEDADSFKTVGDIVNYIEENI